MQFSKRVADRDSWMRQYAVYIPILRELATILKSAIKNLVFPTDDNYIKIEADGLVGKFLTERVLHNFHKTAWISNADRGILNTVVTGNSWFVSQQKGRFTEIVPFGVDQMVVSPLNDDITQATAISILSKRLDELLKSDVLYFNLDKLAERSKGTMPNAASTVNVQQSNINPLDRGVGVTLGEGHLMYQAYVHHMDFDDGTSLDNFIATYVQDYDLLIRFDFQPPGFNPWFLLKWGTQLSGEFWGIGPVQQGLSLQGYANTLMLISLVGDILNAIGVYGYRESGDVIESQVRRNELVIKPNALWKLGPDGEIVPILRDSRTGNVKDLFFIIKNIVTDLMGSHVFFSGNTPDGRSDPTATFTNARKEGAGMRISDIGSIFDEGLIKPAVYRVLKNDQATWWTQGQIIDPYTGQSAERRKINEQAVADAMRDINWDPAIMYREAGFLEGITKDVEVSQIKVTGTASALERQNTQGQLINITNIATQNPMFQPFIKPDKLLRKLLDSTGLKDIDDVTVTLEEQIQSLQEDLKTAQELLTRGMTTDQQTGQPRLLTDQEKMELMNDMNTLKAKINQLSGVTPEHIAELQQTLAPQPVPTGAGMPGPTEMKAVVQA